MMHRLFVALRPPPEMRATLLALMGEVPGARWQDDAQLHLTLRFIGAVERPQAEDIAALLATVTQPAPSIALSGVGMFERRGHPHTIWAGITADDALAVLRQRINRLLMRAALPPEQRAFKPHITLARLDRSAGPTASFIARAATLASPPSRIGAFLLYESNLGRDGATYDAIARFPLT